jgi:hypothetical protein
LEPPIPPLRRARFRSERVDFSKPMVPAHLYKGGRSVVLARIERPRSSLPQETVPMTISEMQHQIDIERGYVDNPADRPSALVGIGQGVSHAAPDMVPRFARGAAMIPMARGMRGLGQGVSRPSLDTASRMRIPMYASPMRANVTRTPSLLLPTTVLSGVGATDETTGFQIGAVGVLIIALSAAGGYFAGAAMAPERKNKTTYGVVGSVLGIFTGPIGLGVLGLVALSKK